MFCENVLALILFLFGTGFALVLEPLMAATANYYLCLLPFALFGISLTAFKNAYKSASSRLIKKEYPQIRKSLWKEISADGRKTDQ